MGRIADLCGEVAAAAEEGRDGLVLSPEAWDRLRGEWSDADIEDALGSSGTRCCSRSWWRRPTT